MNARISSFISVSIEWQICISHFRYIVRKYSHDLKGQACTYVCNVDTYTAK